MGINSDPERSEGPMEPTKKERILNSPWTLIVAVATVGPLAIPLVWRNPGYSKPTKILLTVGIVALTIGLIWMTFYTGDALLNQALESTY